MKRSTMRGFTLVELLVVIGIISILISVLLPSLNRARESANRIQCMSNAKQLINALLLYVHDYQGTLPTPPTVPGSPWSGGIAWDQSGYSPYAVEVNPWYNPKLIPCFLAKYFGVKLQTPSAGNNKMESPPVVHCPSYTLGRRRDATAAEFNERRRTSYMYPTSLYWDPSEMRAYMLGERGELPSIVPVKLSWARHPSEKIALMEFKPWHEKYHPETVLYNGVQVIAMPNYIHAATGKFVSVVTGFCDGSVRWVSSREWCDPYGDPNWTGRGLGANYGYGIRGQDIR